MPTQSQWHPPSDVLGARSPKLSKANGQLPGF